VESKLLASSTLAAVRSALARRTAIVASLALVGLVAFAACGTDDEPTVVGIETEPVRQQEAVVDTQAPEPVDKPEEVVQLDIVDTAIGDGRFETLVAALTAADLVETLRGEGPFTVFAPTDEAFALLPEGTVEDLLKDIPTLTDLLLYHVVAGAVTAEQVVTLDSAETVQGSAVSISVSASGTVSVDKAQVIITDIETSNGVIHVINAVLIPEQG
jgi:uncharacterized surface protein with fasciclin (FAS1) repeats